MTQYEYLSSEIRTRTTRATIIKTLKQIRYLIRRIQTLGSSESESNLLFDYNGSEEIDNKEEGLDLNMY